MAPRSFWKGYLKLSLVTCPVTMVPATAETAKIRFHTLNRATGNRVEARWIDAGTGATVETEDEVKGYEIGEDQYVVLEDDELDAVALESTRTIDIETFVPAQSIGWIWYDTAHYLAPDGKIGEEAFQVIRAAMQATGTSGIARLVLYRRERAVLLKPLDAGIVLWTLRYGDEVRDAAPYFKDIEAEEPQKEMLSLVGQLIQERSRDWSAQLSQDPVQDKLAAIIKAKEKGSTRPKRAKPAPEAAGNVVNIMDALRRSLAEDKPSRKR